MGERLTGKVALVTGASSGIGAAVARRFAAEGAAVMLADVDRAGLERVAADIGSAGGEVRHALCDVASRGDAEATVARTRDELGGLDVLVNSAGITRRNVAADADFEDAWDRVMAVNMKGTLLMCRAATEVMRAAGGGSVVNLASVMGMVVYPDHLDLSDGFNPYPHSKGGVIQITRDLAVQLAKSGVRVNAVCPGFVYTALTSGVVGNDELHDGLRRLHPMGRLGEADEVANVVLFLASDEASFVTGAAWTVDGGYTAV